MPIRVTISWYNQLKDSFTAPLINLKKLETILKILEKSDLTKKTKVDINTRERLNLKAKEKKEGSTVTNIFHDFELIHDIVVKWRAP